MVHIITISSWMFISLPYPPRCSYHYHILLDDKCVWFNTINHRCWEYFCFSDESRTRTFMYGILYVLPWGLSIVLAQHYISGYCCVLNLVNTTRQKAVYMLLWPTISDIHVHYRSLLFAECLAFSCTLREMSSRVNVKLR